MMVALLYVFFCFNVCHWHCRSGAAGTVVGSSDRVNDVHLLSFNLAQIDMKVGQSTHIGVGDWPIKVPPGEFLCSLNLLELQHDGLISLSGSTVWSFHDLVQYTGRADLIGADSNFAFDGVRRVGIVLIFDEQVLQMPATVIPRVDFKL